MEKMKDSLKAITETTFVPLGIVLLIIVAVKYITEIQFQTEATAAVVKVLEPKVDAIGDIRIQLKVMETKIDRIEKKLD